MMDPIIGAIVGALSADSASKEAVKQQQINGLGQLEWDTSDAFEDFQQPGYQGWDPKEGLG